MKTNLLFPCILLLGLFVLIGCGKDEGNDAQKSEISLDSKHLFFEAEVGEQSIVVTSNGEWSVSGTSDWCTVSPENGGEGETVIQIIVQENTGETDRSCMLTFTSGTATEILEIVQYAPVNTHYVDMDFDDTDHVSIDYYNESTGELHVSYADGMSMPEVSSDDVIVLPYSNDYGSMIRIVKSVSSQGNELILQTDRGTMSNLFENMEFALATNPSMKPDNSGRAVSRSGVPVRIVTPQTISVMHSDGTRQVLYDSRSVTRNLCDGNAHIGYQQDWSGTDLYNGELGTLSWKNCSFDLGLDSYIYFWFGDNYLSQDNIWGFQYYVEGNLNLDLLLIYEFETAPSNELDNLVAQNVIPIQVTFLVGNVPVTVDVQVDLRSYLKMDAEAKISAEAGFYFNYMIGRLGLNWNKDNMDPPQVIQNFGQPSYGLHDPVFNAQGSFHMKGGFYPHISLFFNKLLGPWLSVLPYLQVDLEAGMQVTGSGNDQYLGWKADFGAGLSYNVGIDWAFRKSDNELWSYHDGLQDIDNTYQNLFTAPYSVTLLSPSNGTPLVVGSPVEVQFKASAYSPLTPTQEYDCEWVTICLESTSGGKLSDEFVTTDEYGIAKVTWTPQDVNDKLIARIVDKEGQEINSAEFVPTLQGYDIQLLSPQNGDLLENGFPIGVSFLVTNKAVEETPATPVSGVEVSFSNGEKVVSDDKGVAFTQWVPSFEQPTLTAYIEQPVTDTDGNISMVRLAEATFIPKLIQTSISLLSPVDGYVMRPGEQAEVCFLVQYATDGQTLPSSDRSVRFSSKGGFSANAKTDADGKVMVNWSPANAGDVLTAEVLSAEGETIASAAFTPTIESTLIKLVSPSNGQHLTEGEPVTVTFQTYSSPGNMPVQGETVTFVQQGNGNLSVISAVSDSKGYVSVIWTPEKGGSLTAVLESNGAQAAFLPSWEDSSIVGHWRGIHYKDDVDDMDIPSSLSIIANFESNGYWSISYGGSEDDSSFAGNSWNILDNVLYLYNSGTLTGLFTIKELTDNRLVLYNKSDDTGYWEITFERMNPEEVSKEFRTVFRNGTDEYLKWSRIFDQLFFK